MKPHSRLNSSKNLPNAPLRENTSYRNAATDTHLPPMSLFTRNKAALRPKASATTLLVELPFQQPQQQNEYQVPVLTHRPRRFSSTQHKRVRTTIFHERPQEKPRTTLNPLPLKRLLSTIKPRLELAEQNLGLNYQKVNRNVEGFNLVRSQSTEQYGLRSKKRQSLNSNSRRHDSIEKSRDVGKVMLLKKMELITANRVFKPPFMFHFEKRAIFTNELLKSNFISPRFEEPCVKEKENEMEGNYGYSIPEILVERKRNDAVEMGVEDSPIQRRLAPKYI